MNADVVAFQYVSQLILDEDKVSGRNYAKAKLILGVCSLYLEKRAVSE